MGRKWGLLRLERGTTLGPNMSAGWSELGPRGKSKPGVFFFRPIGPATGSTAFAQVVHGTVSWVYTHYTNAASVLVLNLCRLPRFQSSYLFTAAGRPRDFRLGPHVMPLVCLLRSQTCASWPSHCTGVKVDMWPASGDSIVQQ